MSNQKGLAGMLVVLATLVLLGGVGYGFYKGLVSLKKIPDNSLRTEASPSAQIIQSPTPSAPIFPSPVSLPRVTPSPLPLPTVSPIPSPKPIISSAKVYLGRSSNSMPEQASGEVAINVVGKSPYMDPGAEIVDFTFNITVRNLESNKDYFVDLCRTNEGDCNVIANLKTDSAGTASYSGGTGLSHRKDDPFKSIKIVQPNDSGSCSIVTNPCLRGDYKF